MGGGVESEDGGRREYGLECITSLKSPHREEQQVVASVEVTLLHIALILLLVDPIDDALMAINRL